ncbi:hypothetical protein PanWU01x14_150120 [Parasponia andersonii]|uniref:Uncharacterized protein n=1 Tax=Parasponia andersonii TaxID=3476 RepID=A0A2P5CIL9_PARAD|nr:hypothetical protein PanWU01x14_150120 [Parasponia andersonii]
MGPINPSEQLKLTHLPRDLSLGVPGEKPSRRSHHQPNQPKPNQMGPTKRVKLMMMVVVMIIKTQGNIIMIQ